MTTDRDNALRSANPEAVRLYRSLRAALRPFGAFHEEVKKTSVHFVRGSAFAGVHFRRSHLLLTIKTAAPIDSPRIVKVEQVSKNRWHCEVKLSVETEIDGDLTTWMRTAYDLCA